MRPVPPLLTVLPPPSANDCPLVTLTLFDVVFAAASVPVFVDSWFVLPIPVTAFKLRLPAA